MSLNYERYISSTEWQKSSIYAAACGGAWRERDEGF